MPEAIGGGDGPTELLNVSYDPTRELWKALNEAFIAEHLRATGKALRIKQSHGASASQARAVIDGLEADVVSLALWGDIDAIQQRGLIAKDWEQRLPNRSLPYTSTVVFVVRKGNPYGVLDWPDLVQDGLEVITPNPKTSGNGKYSLLAAWGSVLLRGGDESSAREFIEQLYRRVPVLDTGARGATTTFSQRGIGDVHLTWESEARLEVAESKGKLEIIYPPISIRAEPPLTLVDTVVDRRGSRAVAESYLKFLFTPAGQSIIAQHDYRPSDPQVLAAHRDRFPAIKLFELTEIVSDWPAAQAKFFADGALFDQLFDAAGKNE